MKFIGRTARFTTDYKPEVTYNKRFLSKDQLSRIKQIEEEQRK
jgi:hypothetical protein